MKLTEAQIEALRLLVHPPYFTHSNRPPLRVIDSLARRDLIEPCAPTNLLASKIGLSMRLTDSGRHALAGGEGK